MKDKGIIFFTRIPILGKTKTRLEPFIGREYCVKLQKAFIKDIFNNIRDTGIDIIINYTDQGDLEELVEITSKDVLFFKQSGKDLGEKMHKGISFALNNYRKLVLIGSDLPLIGKEDMEIAFQILEVKDIVISPTFDGGYYLIGMKEETPDIFNMKYSNESVFEETINKIESLGKSYGKGNIQLDIDDKDDFLMLYERLRDDKSIKCDETRRVVKEIMEKCDKNGYE